MSILQLKTPAIFGNRTYGIGEAVETDDAGRVAFMIGMNDAIDITPPPPPPEPEAEVETELRKSKKS